MYRLRRDEKTGTATLKNLFIYVRYSGPKYTLCASVSASDVTTSHRARWNARLTCATSSFSHEIEISLDMYGATYLLHSVNPEKFSGTDISEKTF